MHSYVHIWTIQERFHLKSVRKVLKWQCHDIQWFFCAFFCARKKWRQRKCRGYQTMTARSAARTASPPKMSRENVVFLEQLSFSAALPCGRHYFSPHKMAAKNHWLSWHCRFKILQCRQEDTLSKLHNLCCFYWQWLWVHEYQISLSMSQWTRGKVLCVLFFFGILHLLTNWKEWNTSSWSLYTSTLQTLWRSTDPQV